MTAVPITQLVSLTIAVQTVHTVYQDRRLTVSTIHLCNVTALAALVRLYLVPPGGAAASTNAVLYDYSVAANSYAELGLGMIIPPGTIIRAACGVDNAVNISLSGVEQ